MEVKHIRTRFGKKGMLKEHAVGVPISSAKYAFAYKNCLKELLPDPDFQFQLLPSPSTHYSKIRTGKHFFLQSVLRRRKNIYIVIINKNKSQLMLSLKLNMLIILQIEEIR